jgi:hypothetical protein
MAQFSNSRPRYSSGRTRRTGRSTRRTRSVGPAPAKRRGPAPILIIAGVLVLLVFCWIFGRGCGGNQEAKANEDLRVYTSDSNKIINRSAAIGAQFGALKTGIKGLARNDVDQKLQQMIKTAKQVSQDTTLVKVPSKALTLQPLLQLTMDLRVGGIEQYRSAILDILDKKNTTAATATMSNGLLDLVVSDRSLQRFRGSLQDKLSAAKFGFEKVADSIYMPKVDEALTAGVVEYVASISGTEVGNALHGVAVIGLATTPARVDTTSSGVSILPYSKTFTVKVSVQNQGNQEEDDVPVVATLDQDPPTTQQKKTQKITRLKPGETATLVFEDIVPGTGSSIVNALKVTAGPVPGEKKVDNNTMELHFIMRSDTSQTTPSSATQ